MVSKITIGLNVRDTCTIYYNILIPRIDNITVIMFGSVFYILVPIWIEEPNVQDQNK